MKPTLTLLTALLLAPLAALHADPSAGAKLGQPSENTPTTGMPAKPWQMGAPIVTYWAGPMPMTDAVAKPMADGNWNLA